MKPGGTRLAGIVGFPVVHSVSPVLHGFWLREYGLSGGYVPLAVCREEFFKVIDGLCAAGFVGVNVTVPHKEAAFAISQHVDQPARLAGAANLLLFHTHGIEGRNTDVDGVAASLEENLGEDALNGKTVVILGSGGAARAAVFATARLRAGEIRVASRNANSSNALVAALKSHIAPPLVSVAWSERTASTGDSALLVNTTSAGMHGSAPLDMSVDALPGDAVVCDIVYNPLETDLLRRAQAGGHRVVDGLGMLMHQAVPAFEAFYGERPKVTPALRAELKKALRHG
jgi:shikimate dehydrogenase